MCVTHPILLVPKGIYCYSVWSFQHAPCRRSEMYCWSCNSLFIYFLGAVGGAKGVLTRLMRLAQRNLLDPATRWRAERKTPARPTSPVPGPFHHKGRVSASLTKARVCSSLASWQPLCVFKELCCSLAQMRPIVWLLNVVYLRRFVTNRPAIKYVCWNGVNVSIWSLNWQTFSIKTHAAAFKHKMNMNIKRTIAEISLGHTSLNHVC